MGLSVYIFKNKELDKPLKTFFTDCDTYKQADKQLRSFLYIRQGLFLELLDLDFGDINFYYECTEALLDLKELIDNLLNDEDFSIECYHEVNSEFIDTYEEFIEEITYFQEELSRVDPKYQHFISCSY
jgi:hypothetical protein